MVVHMSVASNGGDSCFQVDYEEAMFLWRVEKKDFLLWLAASIFTLFLGIEVGVLIGVSAFSLCT